MQRLFSVLAFLVFTLGTASLALTLYLWFGDWPQEMKQTLDHLRSARENRLVDLDEAT